MTGTLAQIQPMPPGGSLETIGAVLRNLQGEFPDLTISKIRFLESEGLLDPIRTPSGYRKFADRDVERLKYILRAQRDHFLPLRVIAEHLDAIDRGLLPPDVADSTPRVPGGMATEDAVPTTDPDVAGQVRVSRSELARESGLELAQVIAAQDAGLIRPLADGAHYGPDAVEIARIVAQLLDLGIDLRHLATNRRAAASQFERVEAMARVARGSHGAPLADSARRQVEQLTLLQARLHAHLLRAELGDLLSRCGVRA